MQAPIVRRLQYFNLPFNAFEVTRMLIGPAMGMEKTNPAIKPAIDIVIRLSDIINLNYSLPFLLYSSPAIFKSSTVSISVQKYSVMSTA